MKPFFLFALGLLLGCAAAASSEAMVDSAAAAMALPLRAAQD